MIRMDRPWLKKLVLYCEPSDALRVIFNVGICTNDQHPQRRLENQWRFQEDRCWKCKPLFKSHPASNGIPFQFPTRKGNPESWPAMLSRSSCLEKSDGSTCKRRVGLQLLFETTKKYVEKQGTKTPPENITAILFIHRTVAWESLVLVPLFRCALPSFLQSLLSSFGTCKGHGVKIICSETSLLKTCRNTRPPHQHRVDWPQRCQELNLTAASEGLWIWMKPAWNHITGKRTRIARISKSSVGRVWSGLRSFSCSQHEPRNVTHKKYTIYLICSRAVSVLKRGEHYARRQGWSISRFDGRRKHITNGMSVWYLLMYFLCAEPKTIFPAQRGVLVLLLGSGGWDVFARRCFCVCNRPQPFATVGNRWQPSASDYRGGKMAVPMASSATVVRFQMSHSFVSRGRRGTLWHSNMFHNASKVVFYGRRNTLLLRLFQKMICILRGRRIALEISVVILRCRRSTSDVSRCVFLASPNVRSPSSGDCVQIPWQAWGILKVSFCMASAAFGENLSCVECSFAWQPQCLARSTLHTSPLHFTLDTPHSTLGSTLYTPHFILHTAHLTLYTLHCTHSTLYSLHSAPYTLHSSLHTLYFTLRSPHSALQTPHCTLHTVHFTLHTLHFTLLSPYSILYTPPLSTLHAPNFTL